MENLSIGDVIFGANNTAQSAGPLPLAKTYWMIVSPQKRVKKSQQFVPAKHSYIM